MRWFPMLLLLGFTSITIAAPIPKEVKFASDAQLILGTWQTEFISNGGKDKKPYVSMRFRFEADGKCGDYYLRPKDKYVPDSEFELDTSSNPRRMKWLYVTSKIEWRCLYELDGDTLIIAFINAGTELPPKIEPGPNTTIHYLKRIKE